MYACMYACMHACMHACMLYPCECDILRNVSPIDLKYDIRPPEIRTLLILGPLLKTIGLIGLIHYSAFSAAKAM